MFGSSQWMYASSVADYYDYTIDQSLRFEDGDSPTIVRTPSSAGNRQTWTVSFWVKRVNIGINTSIFSAGTTEGTRFSLRFTSNDQLYILDQTSGTYQTYLLTTQTFRDCSSWYHIVFAVDSTQGTASNRERLYINGEEVTAWGNSDYVSQNANFHVNNTIRHNIGIRGDITEYLDAHLAEFHLVDGSQLSPTSFGEFGDYGDWRPIEYTGSHGTNGVYLNFSNSSSLGEDQAGSNDWTPNNIATTDVVLDTPTNNFATLNPIDNWVGDASTLSEGNLKAEDNSSITVNFSTMSMRTGKWYWEILCTNSWFSGSDEYGIIDPELCYTTTSGSTPADIGTGAYIFYGSGAKKINGTYTSGLGVSIATNDILSFAFDADTGTLTIYKNGASELELTTSIPTGKDYKVSISNSHGTYELDYVINFGQDSSFAGNKTAQGNQDGNSIGDFYYTPPTGYLALCTANLSNPTVTPSSHFNTVLYTGNDTDGHSITGVGFQSDLTWIKDRSNAYNHELVDSVRGVTKVLFSNLTNSEQTETGSLSAFNSDGFTVNSNRANVNASGDKYVAWNWKASGSTASNSDGDITSTVSVNSSAGFSIVSYTGTGTAGDTVGHGLSSAPEMIIVKNRDASDRGWFVYHSGNTSAPETDYLYLNNANATSDYEGGWNDTAPTSSVFSIGNSNETNASGQNLIAYCFHSVDGYSKIGSYTGNGSTDGTFVHTGFRPAFVLFKSTGQLEDWIIVDTERDIYNPAGRNWVYADSSSAGSLDGANTKAIDYLSNGFKPRASSSFYNTSGQNYIYLAFAESPFKYSNAR